MNQSLYECIVEGLVDGKLPVGFSLPDEDEDGAEKLRFVDGAQDGIYIYHMGHGAISDENRPLLADAIEAMGRGEQNEADRLFAELGRKQRAIAIIEDLQQYIIDNREHIAANHAFQYGVHAVVSSDDRECVKFGLSILELLPYADERFKQMIRTIGLSDEFTIFAVFVMSRWENANEEIFALARKVHGWGRIHAVERLSPDTPAIREWLFREGIHNDVLPAYIAVNCWDGSDAEERLRRDDLSYEDFVCVRNLLEGLLDEGPCSGISLYDNRDDIILTFLQKARSMPLTADDKEIFRTIRYEYETENGDIAPLADEILHQFDLD